MANTVIFACACPACRETQLVPAADIHKPIAPLCHCPTRETVDFEFGPDDWDRCTEPRLLRDCLGILCLPSSRRQLRLLGVALGHLVYDWCKNYWFREAIDAGEELADDKNTKRDLAGIRNTLEPYIFSRPYGKTDWVPVGLVCIADEPAFPPDGLDGNLKPNIAQAYRELFPNPFLSLAWKPEWLTSTARELAAHIYDARDFAAMPVLADALQDAGCDDEQVLNHCRANKPHARGCWVVDAILGKS